MFSHHVGGIATHIAADTVSISCMVDQTEITGPEETRFSTIVDHDD